MEYVLIIVLQLIGIGFHIMQKIISLGDKHPDKNRSQIISGFLYEDWDTLVVSGLVLTLNVITHYITENYLKSAREWEYYHVASFAVALIMGYAGQRLAYKWLGSAEEFLNKKVTDKLK